MSSPSSSVRPSVLASIGHLVSLVAGLLALCAMAGVLLAAFALPAVTVASAVARDGVALFESLPSELEVEPLNEASHIYAADGSLLATFYSENRIIVPLSDVDQDLQHAVIAIEDRRFYSHNGVDFQGLLRAAVSNVSGSSTQGGSTLTQQYVKNALLMDAFQRGDEEAMAQATETSLVRKAREAKIAITLERQWSKEQILEGYVNVAQFGPSQYGVETAAQHYFSKSANDLTPGEAALLAGITNSPNTNDPVSNPENGMRRRNLVLEDMHELGFITAEEYELYRNQSIEEMLNVRNVTAGCADAGGSGFFCDYVTRSLLNDPGFGETFDERRKKLYGGGLEIHTTLDRERQAIAEEIVNRRVPATAEHGFGHTITTVEPGTGKILVMAQNRNFNPRESAGVGETSLNYNVPKHLGGGNGFPVGSTFKPFVLTDYLAKRGGSVWTQVETRKENFREFPAECLPGGRWFEAAGWDPDNATSIRLPARQTLVEATKYSINTSYARIALMTDLCSIAETARSMGAVPTYYDDSSEEGRTRPVADIYGQTIAPAVLALGELNISQLDMAAAYAVFAAEGVYCTPTAVTKVVDREGNEVPFTGSQCSQVIDKEVADALAWTLEQDLTDPRATGRGRTIDGHDAGGKTGTSGSQYHTWYVGFTRQMSTAVWFGNPTSDRRPGGFQVDGRYLQRGQVWGATVSLPTWHEYMQRAMAGLESRPFPDPPAKPAGIERTDAAPELDNDADPQPGGGQEGPGEPADARSDDED